MKWIHYSRYTGEDLGIDAEDLLKALADFLLESGFSTQNMPFSEWDQHTLEDLKKAIQDAPYIIYRRYHLAHESWRLGIVYSVSPPTVGDIQILSAYRAGHEARPHLV